MIDPDFGPEPDPGKARLRWRQARINRGNTGEVDKALAILASLKHMAQLGCENTDQRHYPMLSCRTDENRKKFSQYSAEDWCYPCYAKDILEKMGK